MSNFPRRARYAITGIFAVLLLLFAPVAPGGIGGVYRGISKNNVLNPKGITPIKFKRSEIKLRLPNGKGNLRGKLLTSKLDPDAKDIPIQGRVAKCAVRQGGSHVIVSGKWEWNFKPLGAKRPANGQFRFSIRKSGRKYRIDPAEKVKVRAGGAAEYVFTSNVTAQK